MIHREKNCDRQGCAKCRIQGGMCQEHVSPLGDAPWYSLVRERARLGRILKMKTVRMTLVMAFCFTVCQIPGATIYIVAWRQGQGNNVTLPPLLVEVCPGIRPLYVVIVPLLHGAVVERPAPAQAQAPYKLTFSRNPSMIPVYTLDP